MNLIKIVSFVTKSGKEPFTEWEDSLEKGTQIIVASRLDRVRLGNFGDCKLIKGGEGIKELRINFGPGYRIYFGIDSATLVILLIGGEKRSQNRDIEKAKKYWLEYMRHLK
jgi:putative addiction module killer protein